MRLRPNEIASILREQIEKYDTPTDIDEVGTIIQLPTASPASTGSRTASRSR